MLDSENERAAMAGRDHPASVPRRTPRRILRLVGSDPARSDDTEISLVVIVLSVGLAVSVAALVLQWFQQFVSAPSAPRRLVHPVPVTAPGVHTPRACGSPPPPLRI